MEDVAAAATLLLLVVDAAVAESADEGRGTAAAGEADVDASVKLASLPAVVDRAGN